MALKLKWNRDPSVPFPNVWKTFTAPGLDASKLQEYEIKEVTEDQFEEAFALYVKVYLPNEPMSAALGMMNDRNSVEWFKKYAFSSVKQKMGLACFDTSTGKIVGVNFLYVLRKDDERVSDQLRALVPSDTVLRTWFDTIFIRNGGIDLFSKYDVDKILGSVALAIDPDYTKRGIAKEILMARIPIGKAFGIRLTVSGFSSKYAIYIAQKLGYTFEQKITYKELAKLDPRFTPYNSLPDDCEYNTYQSFILN
ncbi:hypothetical protein Bhyg_07306 [Pseudolycoriella hygida]|uniref:N-acetyltransferase domain-containing protein n=1 Tax=Pseudolycoriella hygida TaxID=35572 RepID=A0A9Q0S391_9DIPT|nr:hypothetical protein Bhyg_07306 [Pseudolycoriella hygida]